MQKVLVIVALCLGLSIAYMDSRPTWDDTGITVMALLFSSGMLGFLGPKRPWLWALAVGIWIPLLAILTKHNFGLIVVFIFPFLGAYAGMALRRVLKLAAA